MLKLSSSAPADDTPGQAAAAQDALAPAARGPPPPAQGHEDKPGAGAGADAGKPSPDAGRETKPAFSVAASVAAAAADEPFTDEPQSNTSSERSSLTFDQGPLVASVSASGEPQNPRQAAALTASEEALIARQTDMLAPKAPVPELRSPKRESSDASETAGAAPSAAAGSGARPPAAAAAASEDTPVLAAAEPPSRSSDSTAPRSAHSRPSARSSSAKKTPTLGPMEPMEPMEPASTRSEHKKLPPLDAGFPTVPGFPGDPGASTMLPSSLALHGKRVHSLPSLVESARNMASDSARHATSQFSTPNTNLMADIYTHPNSDPSLLPGMAPRGAVAGGAGSGHSNTSTRASGWGYDDGSVASRAVSYTPSSPRSRDPRFSYAYPHGVLSGPAGIVPDAMDSLAPIRSQYGHVGPPPMMAMPPGVPYQTSHGPVSVMPPGAPGAPQQQHHQQAPLASAAFPVVMNAPQVYSSQLPPPPPQYMRNPQDGMEQQLAPPAPMHMLPVSRETSVAPAPPSHAGHGGGLAWNSGPRPQTFAPAASESRTYRCTYPGCEWSFVRSSDQKRHIRSHEKPSLQCPYWEIHSNCNRKGGLFYRLDVLKRHLRLVHLIRPANGADDGGSCRVCGKMFEHTRDFISHCSACAEDAKQRMMSEGGPPEPGAA